MRKINIDGKAVTVGLDWDALKGNSSIAKEKKQLVKMNPGVKKGIIIKSGGLTVIGMVPPNEKLKAPSAAAWLAEANRKYNLMNSKADENLEDENWIVVEEISKEEDEYWLAVIKDGVPLPGVDSIDTLQETLSKIDQLVSSSQFVIHAPEEIRTIFDDTASTNKGFTDLIEKVKYKGSATQLSGVDPAQLSLVLLFILGIGGYYAYDTWSTAQEQEEAMRLANENKQKASADTQKSQITYEEAKKEALKQAFKQAEDSLNGLLSQPSSTNLMYAWYDLITQVKMSHNGWKIEGIECALEGEVPVCAVNLTRGDYGINRSLMQDFPTAVINGDNAQYILKGNALSKENGDYKTLATGNEFKVNTLSDLQLLKYGDVKHTADSSSEVTQAVKLPDPPTGIQQDMNIQPIKMGVGVGALHIQGTDMWQLKGVGDVLSSSDITLQKISIQVPENFGSSEWKLEGVYYIKLGEPVMPVIPPSKTLGT
ncbi:TPA: type 4b pilus protein PilO2 [Escherichia coli]|nr:type 4b pilus protein PilO2 [Escherichia coli]